MDLFRRVSRMVPQAQPSHLPTSDEKRPARLRPTTSPFAVLKRPLRLRGNSSISVPLGVVIVFPLVMVILFLMILRPHNHGGGNVQENLPPSIRKISEKYDKVFVSGCLQPDTSKPRANATIVVLARNKELEGVIQSMKSFERHFNHWYNYPYTFLNDGEFNQTFKDVVRQYTNSKVEFGTVSPDMWGFPDWIDPKVAKEGIAKQGDAAVMYGGMESYHSMCRFYSGFFYKHELLHKYEWYWRLEPEIKYFCDITYDPFVKMIEANKTYGFTIALKELKETVPNLFRYASAYKRKNNIKSQGLWEMFVNKKPESEDAPQSPNLAMPLDILRGYGDGNALPNIESDEMDGESYNMCHFWSNFEIAKLSWFRSKEYEEFFQTMDRSGGFWMERWGDAPIHSLAAGALLGVKDVHYFRDFGYRHTTIQHCPGNAPSRQLPREKWLEQTTLDERKRIEEDDYFEHWDAEQENGVGCRCRCDTDIVDVEGKEGSCLSEWVEVAGGWASP
ncbi:O-glycoside alpha-1,2-mannosyltransferase -like protein 4 [Ceratocystis lukuohia]|uniref:O-glycoside alpha-1,2-mannosyltransferase -like protein 4 n=1 Tax=Ceratocystis lukuohia TaxID=2019550 RepID=A0ABR4MJM6_9PEZI